MTLQEAQNQLSRIVQSLSVHSDRDAALSALDELFNALPTSAEFDTMRERITEIGDTWTNALTAEVVADLQSRDDIYRRAIDQLQAVSTEAEAAGAMLRLTKPNLVIPALTKSIEQVKAIADKIDNANYKDAATDVRALIVFVEELKIRLTT